MANWLGIRAEYKFPSQDTLDARCGFYASEIIKAKPNSDEFYRASDDQKSCIESVYSVSSTKQQSQQDLIDYAVWGATFVVLAVLLWFFWKSIPRALENMFVGTVASAIRRKRMIIKYASGLKTRIEDKANTDAD
ncbi:hypothetical protein AMC83_PA00009 (plasmid) [Rhizobium phaseoli]|uniref:hypothetical protein n=1 Tax=Rhizobium phaseoli TaxID=396 RepID=UPI0007EAA401|nr:hypothetical protein [Rhizobium phaseoli]ANL74236.1 hypothetical protein AMC83_PA00009 [Rhizobium phaseoli]